jgi:hypothetical protein
MDTERFAPAGPWQAFDGSRPPHARPDKRPAWCDIHKLACADAEHGVHASLDEAGQMGIRTESPIGHQPIPFVSARMHGRHLSQVVGAERRDHQLEEHPAAGMEEPQAPGDGNAAPRPLLRRLAKRRLSGGRSGHGASRAIAQEGAVAMPLPFVHGGALHRAAEALQEEVKEASRESGTGLTGGRRAEPSARPMGEMTAGGLAMQHLHCHAASARASAGWW